MPSSRASRPSGALGPFPLVFVLAVSGCGAGPAALEPSRGVDLAPPGVSVDMILVVDLGPCGECGGETPRCDAAARRCVACLADAHCPVGHVCSGGACTPGCSAQRRDCGDAGVCDVDAGACRECAADRDCRDPARPRCDVQSGGCLACKPESDNCGAGQYCDTSGGRAECAPGCKNDVDCRNGGGGITSACCDHACVDTRTSLAHCGTCGTSCGIDADAACCDSVCVRTRTDVAACGACGNVCVAPNATPICRTGNCSVGACLAGYADCDQKPVNGCEIDVRSSLAHCGGCGRTCALPNANTLCLAGACAIAGCQPSFRDCNSDPMDGCEVSTLTDPANCGGCGSNCGRLPNAVAGCVMGACQIGACSAGFADCNKVGNDGCEARLDGDAANCGGCGRACPGAPNVLTTCTMGNCGVAGCVPGFTDCDMNPLNGCEAALASDGSNCGVCGRSCAPGVNASGACVAGNCTFACNAGFADCDANRNNGCEVDLRGDIANCGACGVACGQGRACVNSACQDANGCSGSAKFSREVAPGLWACVTDHLILSYAENNALCNVGWTPATFKLVQGLRMPTLAEHQAHYAWYNGVNGNNGGYIRTGQKRRGGCTPDAHGDIYVVNGDQGWTSNTGGWRDLFNGGSSCNNQTDSANNVGHALAGVVCVKGAYELPSP